MLWKSIQQYHQVTNQFNLRQYHHYHQLLIHSQLFTSITNLIISIINLISCIFLSIFYPLKGGEHGIVCHTMTHTVNLTSNVSTLDGTHFFNSYNQMQQFSSQHHGDLMNLLHKTVNHNNVTNNVLLWFPSHNQDIWSWVASILYK